MKIKVPIKYRWYRFEAKIHRFLVWHTPFSICQGGEGPCFRRGKRMRQNTAYADDKRNWVRLCPECAQINSEYWAERWQDYYSQVT